MDDERRQHRKVRLQARQKQPEVREAGSSEVFTGLSRLLGDSQRLPKTYLDQNWHLERDI